MRKNGSATTHVQTENDLGVVASEISLPRGEDEQRGILFALRHLWSRRRLIQRVSVIGFILSLLIAFLIPKTYKSTVQLMPPDSQAQSGLALLASLSGGIGGGLNGVAGDLFGLKSTGALFMGVLRSRSVQDSVIEKFDLRKVYGVSLMQNARTKLQERTSISEDRKSGIITIEVVDRDPKRATAIAQSYIESLNKVVTQVATSSARKEREFLEARLQTVQEDLDKAQREFSVFSSRNSTLDIKEQAKTMVEAAATLQGQLIAAQSELSGLETIYTPNNVRVRALRARIAQLQAQINKMGGTPTPFHPSGENSDSEATYGVPSIRQLPLLGVQYADLYRRVKVQDAIFEVLTKQYELAKVQEAKETPSVKVLDPPNVPEKKDGPPRLVLSIIGALIAFSGCCFGILLMMSWNRVDPDDERKLFLHEVFSSIRGYGLKLRFQFRDRKIERSKSLSR
jgi:uncharacterized protein involved in exopolysaccharide biosynthesis